MLGLLALEVDLGEDSEEVSFLLRLATAEVPDWSWLGSGRGVGAAVEVHGLKNSKLLLEILLRLSECLLRSWLGSGLRLRLLEGLLRSGLRLRGRLRSGLWSGLRLGDGVLLRLLLVLDNLCLELLFSVYSFLDLIKEALSLGSTWVECVGSRLWLLLLWRLSLLWLLLRHKLWLLLTCRLLLSRSSWLTLEAVKGRSGGRRCPNSGSRSLLAAKPPIIAAGLLVDPADVDVAGEAGHSLPVPGVGDDLGHPAVTGGVPAQDGLSCPVPLASKGAWTTVTPIPGLPQVPLTSGVGVPGSIN